MFGHLELHAAIGKALMAMLAWSSPWYWVVLAVALFTVGLVHPVPWTLKDDEESFVSHLVLWVRKVAAYTALWGILALPLLVYCTFVLSADTSSGEASAAFLAWAADRLGRYWMLVVGAFVVGLALRFLWDRYAVPVLSKYWRTLRITQETDKLVDAREEVATLKAKEFSPEDYFVDGKIFYGLDENEQPIYFDLDRFRTTHHAILGPTNYGKGIVLQSIFKQCIRNGFGIFYVDPKGDNWLPFLLQNEAKAAGRRFVYLDLNPEGKGVWHPFLGGAFRQRRTRIVRAFNLESFGTDADVHKAKERGLLDDALENTDGTIKSLLEYVKKNAETGRDNLSTLRDSLREWARVDTFSQSVKRKGHSIEQCLMNNAIVYIRGDLADPVVKAATKAYISELVTEIKRLDAARPAHVVLGIDELKFLACAEINEALATIRQHQCNMLLAAQSIANLEAPDDKRLDGKALAREFEVNTPIKFVYRAADERTAEWAENLSAGQWLNVVQREQTKANQHGGEQWEGNRMVGKVEQAVVSRNTLLNLPERIAIAYMPGRIASKLYTCHTKIDNSFASWKKTDDDATMAA